MSNSADIQRRTHVEDLSREHATFMSNFFEWAYDLAFTHGYKHGYEEGFKDGNNKRIKK